MKLDLKRLKLRDVNEKLQSLNRKQNDRNFTIINFCSLIKIWINYKLILIKF